MAMVGDPAMFLSPALAEDQGTAGTATIDLRAMFWTWWGTHVGYVDWALADVQGTPGTVTCFQ